MIVTIPGAEIAEAVISDHYLYICDVEQVYGEEAEEALFAWNGYSQLRPAKQGGAERGSFRTGGCQIFSSFLFRSSDCDGKDGKAFESRAARTDSG